MVPDVPRVATEEKSIVIGPLLVKVPPVNGAK